MKNTSDEVHDFKSGEVDLRVWDWMEVLCTRPQGGRGKNKKLFFARTKVQMRRAQCEAAPALAADSGASWTL